MIQTYARKAGIALLALAVILVLASIAVAQSANDYDLSWWTVDGGGYTSGAGGGYALSGTAGEPDATLLTGGSYTLIGGFWGAAPVQVDHVLYLPLILRSAG